MRALAALGLLSACAMTTDVSQVPEPFGITMVEETACVGAGGRIVMGPEGAFCDGAT